jgi:hypothetical protein
MSEKKKNKKAFLYITLENEKIKEAWDQYAKSRGLENAKAFAVFAMGESFRRRPPKDAPDVLQYLLK